MQVANDGSISSIRFLNRRCVVDASDPVSTPATISKAATAISARVVWSSTDSSWKPTPELPKRAIWSPKIRATSAWRPTRSPLAKSVCWFAPPLFKKPTKVAM